MAVDGVAGDSGGGGAASGDDAFARALGRMVAQAAATEAARERVQERTLRTVAEAEATFVGLAVDLAEGGAGVVLRTAGGRSHRGRLVAVGRDFVVVRDGPGAPVLLALEAVASLRPAPTDARTTGDAAGGRAAPLDVSLASLLSRLGAERPRVQLVVAGDDLLSGEMRSVGVDVLTIRLDADRRPVVHVHLAAIHEVVLLDL